VQPHRRAVRRDSDVARERADRAALDVDGAKRGLVVRLQTLEHPSDAAANRPRRLVRPPAPGGRLLGESLHCARASGVAPRVLGDGVPYDAEEPGSALLRAPELVAVLDGSSVGVLQNLLGELRRADPSLDEGQELRAAVQKLLPEIEGRLACRSRIHRERT
jgi:hypothetical protein